MSGLALAATTHDQARATSGRRSAAATAQTAAQPALRRLAQRAGMHIGSAFQAQHLADRAYSALVAREVDTITFENDLKWRRVHPAPRRFDFKAADRVASFARAHGIRLRGHVLVWHVQNPSWLVRLRPTRRQALRLLREHIQRVIGHFRRRWPGLVRDWDVVNEAVDNDGTLRRTIWQRWIGNDYIDWAFRFAREAAGPRARLFYNDYVEGAMPAASESIGGEFDNYDPHPRAYPGATGGQACSEVVKCRAIMRLVERLRRRGVPIDGVGFQGHLLGGNPPDYVGLTRWVRKLGLRWAITELDLPLPAGASANDRERQGAAFAQAVKACRRDPACDTVVFWGLSDRYTWWRDLTRGALVDATLFDPLLHPKPAYWAVARALR